MPDYKNGKNQDNDEYRLKKRRALKIFCCNHSYYPFYNNIHFKYDATICKWLLFREGENIKQYDACKCRVDQCLKLYDGN